MKTIGARWHSWGAAAPLWVPGLVCIVIGLALIEAARRSVHRV